MSATLVYSSKHFPKSRTLTVWESTDDSFTKLMRGIFAHNGLNNRLKIEKNKYFYQPTNEYKQYVVRFKGVRK